MLLATCRFIEINNYYCKSLLKSNFIQQNSGLLIHYVSRVLLPNTFQHNAPIVIHPVYFLSIEHTLLPHYQTK